ncbi:MAG TPA: response regulator transcription factor [Verrucomicrobiae bacterium]|nr:response regulator transcription factor [Verrucomicrobiae bacterium]
MRKGFRRQGIVKTNDNPSKAIRAKLKRVKIAISIVEDDPHTRGILADWIRAADGFQCVGAHSSGESALTALPAEDPSVVLMDINLPGLNGIECVRRLKPQMPDTQFVMLTVYEDPDHIFKALTAGASGYLLKRTPRAELLAAVRDVFDGGSPMSSNIARKIVQSFQRFSSSPSDSENLSPREHEVLELLARGFLYKEIAEALHISVPTVNTHIRRIYEKLHVRSRSQAVAKYTHIPTAAGIDGS